MSQIPTLYTFRCASLATDPLPCQWVAVQYGIREVTERQHRFSARRAPLLNISSCFIDSVCVLWPIKLWHPFIGLEEAHGSLRMRVLPGSEIVVHTRPLILMRVYYVQTGQDAEEYVGLGGAKVLMI